MVGWGGETKNKANLTLSWSLAMSECHRELYLTAIVNCDNMTIDVSKVTVG